MSDNKIIFSMSGVSKTFPSAQKPVLKNIWLSFFYGAKIGVLGLNGSGKSTLIKIIAGLDQNYEGKIEFEQQFKIGYLSQEPELDDSKTVREVVEEGIGELMDTMKEYEEVNAKFAEEMSDEDMNKLIERQGELMDILDRSGAWELDHKIERSMDALRCPPDDASVKVLSGGERRRVALARLLLSNPDILLLDEPTNHLDAESIDWLEQYLQSFPGTVIAVTHDRYFLDNVAGWILELDRGEGIPWEGNYSSWLEQKAKRLELEQKQDDKRRKTLERELEWIRMSPKAKQSKGKVRLNAYEKLADVETKEKEKKLELTIPPGPRLGDVVIKVENLTKAFDGRVLFENLSFDIPKNSIIGIIGPNGVGKSTLFRMLVDQQQPDSGNIEIGDTVKLSYVDQSHDAIDPSKSVYEVVSDGLDILTVGSYEVNSRAYISKFNFSGSDQQKKSGVLSGGERNRLHLAMTLKDGGNVLLLDEPTNDIDINTLRSLEDALDNFAGCALIISHDRWFIDRLATHVLSFEDEGEVVFFEGNYQEYEAMKKKKFGDVTPKRHRFKNLLQS